MPGMRQIRRRGGGESRPLSECASGECATVVGNTGARSLEMGFYPGAAVSVINNDPSAACMVVMTGESRFVIPREIAATVAVCRCGGAGPVWWCRRAFRQREEGNAQADS